MNRSPSALAEMFRTTIAASLNERVADGVDLYAQIKVAHWNVRGPNFMPLHELFERLAVTVSEQLDTIAERVVTLGAKAQGTVRIAAVKSRLPEYPVETQGDLEHVRLLADRFSLYLQGLRASRQVADQNGDPDTSNLLTDFIISGEKSAWFLFATLGP